MGDLEDRVEIRKEIVKNLKHELTKAENSLMEAELALYKAKPACKSFKWIGQPFTSCDDCGKPYWEHTHDERWVDGKSVPVPITPEQARACKAKWGYYNNFS